jgi:hypothetical protein
MMFRTLWHMRERSPLDFEARASFMQVVASLSVWLLALVCMVLTSTSCDVSWLCGTTIRRLTSSARS